MKNSLEIFKHYMAYSKLIYFGYGVMATSFIIALGHVPGTIINIVAITTIAVSIFLTRYYHLFEDIRLLLVLEFIITGIIFSGYIAYFIFGSLLWLALFLKFFDAFAKVVARSETIIFKDYIKFIAKKDQYQWIIIVGMGISFITYFYYPASTAITITAAFACSADIIALYHKIKMFQFRDQLSK